MLTEERTMAKELSWDGKTERRKTSRDGLSAHEEVMVLHNQFLLISERITAHKQSQDEGFHKIQESISKIENVLIPKDGSASIFEEIRYLKNTESERKKAVDNIMKIAIGSIAALLISIASWIGKAVLFLLKTMGGN